MASVATPFGKALRKLRIDHGEILADMASKLEVSSAYLSSIELGKKNVPESLIDKLLETYSLSEDQKNEFRRDAELSVNQVKLNLVGTNDLQRDVVLAFARNYKDKTPEELEKLKQLFEKK